MLEGITVPPGSALTNLASLSRNRLEILLQEGLQDALGSGG